MNDDALLIDKLFAPGGVRTLFQPIFDLSRGTPVPWAVECFSRGPRGSHAESAEVLFEYARFRRRESELDKLCLRNALLAAAQLGDGSVISLNVYATTLMRNAGIAPWLLGQAREAGVSPKRIVLEIVDQGPAQDPEGLSRVLGQLRAAGMRVAIDDLGSAVSGLRLVAELAPEIIKIDKFFIASAAANPRCRAVAESLVELADGVGAKVIAEGVENRAHLAMTFSMGIRLVQGYGLCEPLETDELAKRMPQLFDARNSAQSA